MLASIRTLFVILVCIGTTGCLLPMSIGLLSKPIEYVIDQHAAKSAHDEGQPISVSTMLANARGDEVTADSTDNENDAEDKCVNKPRSISVADLLANARSSDTAENNKATSAATHTNQPETTLAQATASDSSLSETRNKELMTVVMGTQTDEASPPSVLPLFLKAREVCSSLGDNCDPEQIRMDPTLPLGTLQISPRGSANDA